MANSALPPTPPLPLRDLHLPEAPGFWPPAPGWWGLLLVAVLIGFMIWWLLQRRRRLAYRRAALKELAQLSRADLSASQLLIQVSLLLRRAAVTAFPGAGCDGLHGEDWLVFLDGRMKKGEGFCHGPGRCLAAGPYQRTPKYERTALLHLCRRWLQQLPALARGRA